jgi:hypothetical protein
MPCATQRTRSGGLGRVPPELSQNRIPEYRVSAPPTAGSVAVVLRSRSGLRPIIDTCARSAVMRQSFGWYLARR